jgi:hypothetical protein
MNGTHSIDGTVHAGSSVVIDNFDACRTNGRPHEADAPLVVDANAVLTFPVAFQCLQSIARRSVQKIQRLRGVKLGELALGHRRKSLESPGAISLEQRLSEFALERLDHAP